MPIRKRCSVISLLRTNEWTNKKKTITSTSCWWFSVCVCLFSSSWCLWPLCHRANHFARKYFIRLRMKFPKLWQWRHHSIPFRLFFSIVNVSKMFSKLFDHINHVWANQFFIESTEVCSERICYANDVKKKSIHGRHKRAQAFFYGASECPKSLKYIRNQTMWCFLVESLFSLFLFFSFSRSPVLSFHRFLLFVRRLDYLLRDLLKYRKTNNYFRSIVPLIMVRFVVCVCVRDEWWLLLGKLLSYLSFHSKLHEFWHWISP